jgi:hypothetical protein
VICGREYVVLGLAFFSHSNGFGTGTYVHLKGDTDDLSWAPIFLFEVVDGSASAHWETRVQEDGTVTLYPPCFYDEYFHFDLSEDEPGAVRCFQDVVSELTHEAEMRSRNTSEETVSTGVAGEGTVTFGGVPEERMELLREVIRKQRADLLPMLRHLGVVPLTDEERQELRDAVINELFGTGLSESRRPNKRGLDLEDLVDLLDQL